MRYFFIFCLFFLSFVSVLAKADFSNLTWHQGAIILTSHEVITGEVSYDPVHDIVLHRTGAKGKMQTFTARQLNYFHYINQQTGVVRRFVALSHGTRVNLLYKRDYFFEIVLSGEVSFLRKPNKKKNLIRLANHSESLSRLDVEKSCYDYYMLNDEKITRIKNFRKDALPLLASEENNSIHQYIASRNITKFTLYQQKVVFHYYNTLQKAKENGSDLRLVQRGELSE